VVEEADRQNALASMLHDGVRESCKKTNKTQRKEKRKNGGEAERGPGRKAAGTEMREKINPVQKTGVEKNAYSRTGREEKWSEARVA